MAPSTRSRPNGSRSRLSIVTPATKRPRGSVDASGIVKSPLPTSAPQVSGASGDAGAPAGPARRIATRTMSMRGDYARRAAIGQGRSAPLLDHAIRRSPSLALLQIERLAGIEDGNAKLGPVASVHGHDLSAHRLRVPAGAHEQRRALVDAHSEQARVREQEREEPVLALAADEVLVEDHAGQEPEPGPHRHLAGVDHGEVSLAGDRERRDDGRAGAGARDGGAVTVAGPQRRRHDIVGERIEQPLLVSPRQEDPGGALQAAPELRASVLAEGRGWGRFHGAGREGTERI